MTEFEWFIKVSDWEFDHLDTVNDRLDYGVWQAIVARLEGWDK
jgi:hypothetical protein